MQPGSESALNLVDLAIDVVVRAAREYRQRWRLYVGTLIVGWWTLIAVELVVIGRLGAPVLIRLESFLFRLSGDDPAEFLNLINDLDINTIGIFLGLNALLLIIESLVIQNVVTGALINIAAGQAGGVRQAYALGAGRYLNLIGVALSTVVMIFLPSIVLVLPLCAVLFIAPQLVEAGLGRVLGQLVILLAAFLCVPASLFFVLRFALGPQAVIIERQHAIGAVRRSWRLLRGLSGMFSVFAVLVLLGIGTMLLGFIAPQFERELSQWITSGLGVPRFALFLISHAFGQILTGFLLPFQAIAMTILYRHLTEQAPPTAPAALETLVVAQPSTGITPEPGGDLKLNIFALPSQATVLAGIICALVVGTVLMIVVNSPLVLAWPVTLLLLGALTARHLLSWPERFWQRRPATLVGANLQPLQQHIDHTAAQVGVGLSLQVAIAQGPAELATVGAFRRRYLVCDQARATALQTALAYPNAAAQADAVVLHELHHYRHGDNLLLGTVEALLLAARDLIVWGGLCVIGLILFLQQAAGDVLSQDPASVAERLAAITGNPADRERFITWFPPEAWANARANLGQFDLGLLLTALVTNIITVVIIALALLLIWRALLRLRELYADGGVAQTQGSIAPLIEALTAFPASQGNRPPPSAFQRIWAGVATWAQDRWWPNWVEQVWAWLRKALSYHPHLVTRLECLRDPMQIFGTASEAGLRIGGTVTVLNLLIWNSSAVLLVGRWPLHIPVVGTVVLACLWALPQLVMGRPVWGEVRRLVLVVVGCYAVPSITTIIMLQLALAVSPSLVAQLSRQVAGIATGAVTIERAGTILAPAELVAFVTASTVMEIMVLTVLILGMSLGGVWLGQRMLTWYSYPDAARRLTPTYLALLGVLLSVGATLVLPIATDLVLLRWGQPVSPAQLIWWGVGGLLGVGGAIWYLIMDRRHRGHCPTCGRRLEGHFALGQRCTQCDTTLHPWLGTSYEAQGGARHV